MEQVQVARYTIPKKKRRLSEDCQEALLIDSREANDLENEIRRQTWEAEDLEKKFTITRLSKVHNSVLEREYQLKRAELRNDGRQGKELVESLAFLVEYNSCRVKEICQHGLKCEGKNNTLGDGSMGVSLWKCPDLCLKGMTCPTSWTVFLIVFKIVKGRVKSVPPKSHEEETNREPTPHFDCHMSKRTINPMTADVAALVIATQYYLYEYNEDGFPTERPRQCLPYAVIQLKKVSKPCAPPVSLMEMITQPAEKSKPCYLTENEGSVAWRGLITNKDKCLGLVALISGHQMSLTIWKSFINIENKLLLKSLSMAIPGDIRSAWDKPLPYRNFTFSLCIAKTSGPQEKFDCFSKALAEAKSAGLVTIDGSTMLFFVPSSALAVHLGLCESIEPVRMYCIVRRLQKPPPSPELLPPQAPSPSKGAQSCRSILLSRLNIHAEHVENIPLPEMKFTAPRIQRSVSLDARKPHKDLSNYIGKRRHSDNLRGNSLQEVKTCRSSPSSTSVSSEESYNAFSPVRESSNSLESEHPQELSENIGNESELESDPMETKKPISSRLVSITEHPEVATNLDSERSVLKMVNSAKYVFVTKIPEISRQPLEEKDVFVEQPKDNANVSCSQIASTKSGTSTLEEETQDGETRTKPRATKFGFSKLKAAYTNLLASRKENSKVTREIRRDDTVSNASETTTASPTIEDDDTVSNASKTTTVSRIIEEDGTVSNTCSTTTASTTIKDDTVSNAFVTTTASTTIEDDDTISYASETTTSSRTIEDDDTISYASETTTALLTIEEEVRQHSSDICGDNRRDTLTPSPSSFDIPFTETREICPEENTNKVNERTLISRLETSDRTHEESSDDSVFANYKDLVSFQRSERENPQTIGSVKTDIPSRRQQHLLCSPLKNVFQTVLNANDNGLTPCTVSKIRTNSSSSGCKVPHSSTSHLDETVERNSLNQVSPIARACELRMKVMATSILGDTDTSAKRARLDLDCSVSDRSSHSPNSSFVPGSTPRSIPEARNDLPAKRVLALSNESHASVGGEDRNKATSTRINSIEFSSPPEKESNACNLAPRSCVPLNSGICEQNYSNTNDSSAMRSQDRFRQVPFQWSNGLEVVESALQFTEEDSLAGYESVQEILEDVEEDVALVLLEEDKVAEISVKSLSDVVKQAFVVYYQTERNVMNEIAIHMSNDFEEDQAMMMLEEDQVTEIAYETDTISIQSDDSDDVIVESVVYASKNFEEDQAIVMLEKDKVTEICTQEEPILKEEIHTFINQTDRQGTERDNNMISNVTADIDPLRSDSSTDCNNGQRLQTTGTSTPTPSVDHASAVPAAASSEHHKGTPPKNVPAESSVNLSNNNVSPENRRPVSGATPIHAADPPDQSTNNSKVRPMMETSRHSSKPVTVKVKRWENAINAAAPLRSLMENARRYAFNNGHTNTTPPANHASAVPGAAAWNVPAKLAVNPPNNNVLPENRRPVSGGDGPLRSLMENARRYANSHSVDQYPTYRQPSPPRKRVFHGSGYYDPSHGPPPPKASRLVDCGYRVHPSTGRANGLPLPRPGPAYLLPHHDRYSRVPSLYPPPPPLHHRPTACREHVSTVSWTNNPNPRPWEEGPPMRNGWCRGDGGWRWGDGC